MSRTTGIAFTALAVLLASAFLERALWGSTGLFRVVRLLFGLGFLVVSLLSLAELGQRLSQLVRLPFTAVSDASDVASLPAGNHWLRAETTVRAVDEPTHGMLEGPPVVTHTTEVRKREGLRGVPRFSTPTGVEVTETEVVPFRLGRDGPAFRVDDDTADLEAVGEEIRDLTADADVPERTASALAAHGVEADVHRSNGYLFEHFLRVREAGVADGAKASFFGPVSVEKGADGTVVRPAGRFVTGPLVTTAGWGAIASRVARRFVVLLVLTLLAAFVAFLLLSAW